VKIHLTWSSRRAAKDKADRERMLERLKKRLDKPYQLKAALRRGCNQYLEMELDTENWKLDESKIIEAARYDGYYAIITNNLSSVYRTEQAGLSFGDYESDTGTTSARAGRIPQNSGYTYPNISNLS